MNTTDLLTRWYRPATLVALLLTLASAFALWDPGLNKDFSLRTLAGRNDDEFRQLEQFMTEFAGVEMALLVVESPSILSSETQKCLNEIVEQAEQLPAVTSVASISKVPWLMRRMVARSEVARGLLVSDDGEVTAVVLQMADDQIAGVPRSTTVEALQAIMAEAEATYADHRLVLTGPYVLSYEMSRLVWADLKLFGALGALTALLTLSVALGAWRLSLYPVAVGVATVLLTLGLSIWWEINTALNLPMLVLLVAVLTMANCIHLAVGHGETPLAEGGARATPTVRRLLWPCFGVIATTIVGFAAVGISDLQPVRTFAVLMSAGLAIGLLLSLLGAFSALQASPKRAMLASPLQGLLRTTLRVATRRPRWLAMSFLVATVAAVGLIGNLQFSLLFLENFRPDDPLRTDYEFVESRLTPMQTIEVLIRRPDQTSPVTPEAVAAINQFTAEFKQREAISRSLSIVDLFTFAGGRLPESQAELDRRLLALEATLKMAMGEDPLGLFLSSDRQTLRIGFIAYEGPSASEKLALGNEIRARASDLLGDEYVVEVTGLYYFYAHVAQSLLRDQIYTLAASAVGVFLTMALVLRSWRLAFLGMAPGIVAGASCVGLMVLFAVPFNTVTSMMLAIALGISVDDTIHYLWRYRTERAGGEDSLQAISNAHLTVGQACTLTSIVVAAGFAVMSFSRFLPIAYFGGITSVVMAVALAANLLLLPALLSLFRHWGNEGQSNRPPE